MSDARLLVAALRDPASVAGLHPERWTELVAMARGESLLGSLAYRLAGMELPEPVQCILADARSAADQARRQALWEAEMARRALAPLGIPVILLKGTAYAAAGLEAGQGRSIGDLDILVPRAALAEVEAALLAAGWEWVKEDAYDDLYYRRWMHELPPLIHRERDRMIDVHHTILPLTHRRKPDAAALIEASVPIGSGLRVLAPEDMIVHSAAHLFGDGDLSGGLRNLWDLHCLFGKLQAQHVVEYGSAAGLEWRVRASAEDHDLAHEVGRAWRISQSLFGIDPVKLTFVDRLFRHRLLARNGWGQQTRPAVRLGFYIRSHWLRMPPLMLARHLWTKARK
jgi:hypothetical protein